MSYTHETIKSRIKYGHSISTSVQKEYSIHFHNVYEIYYFIRGDVDYLVEGKSYHPSPNSLILLAPHTFHGVRVNSDEPYERYTLHFHPSLIDISKRPLLLSSFPSNKKEMKKEVYFQDGESYHLNNLFELFDRTYHQENSIIHNLLPTYLETLLATITLLSNTMSPTDISNPISSHILAIIEYINDNLTQPIHLDELCNTFYISKNQLNRSFRKATGTTVYDYLLHKRVILAKQLIHNGYNSIDAAIAVGFKDYSNFFRAYKKILGYAPSKNEYEVN